MTFFPHFPAETKIYVQAGVEVLAAHTHSDGMQAGAVCWQLVIRWEMWKRRMEGYLAMV